MKFQPYTHTVQRQIFLYKKYLLLIRIPLKLQRSVIAKDVNGNPVVMRTLIGSYCTGKGLVALKTAKTLGLDRRPDMHWGIFTSVSGKFKTNWCASIPSVVLPVLSQDMYYSLIGIRGGAG